MKKMIKAAVVCLGLAVRTGLAVDAVAPAPKPRPNVLLIVADDLGYGELSCQGNPQIPTPNIDSIAKNGIRFTNGYVSCPVCSPTRAGLMTGKYQQRFGHEFNPGPAQAASPNFGLSLKERTIADDLKAAGYATGMFGKWHLGYKPEYHPMQRGFDEYFGFLGGAHPYLNAGTNGPNPILRGTTPVDSIDYTTDAFGREAAAFIDKHHAEPWFVYLPFNSVHAPLQTLPKYRQRFTSIRNEKRQTFAGMLSAMDDAVGVVLGKIHEHNLDENTLIFFISDNGGPTQSTTSRNDPLRGVKGQVLEGGIREPFMVQWKGHLPEGKVDDRPVIQLDILPTALAAAGSPVSPEANLDGVNLLPYLNGDSTNPPHEALCWRFGRQHAIRMGDWKLENQGDGERLYNLAKDIREQTDLSTQEPAKVKELEAGYQKWNALNIAPKWGGNKPGQAAGPTTQPNTPKGFKPEDDE
jgi:arylsulfatase A-like enzyme